MNRRFAWLALVIVVVIAALIAWRWPSEREQVALEAGKPAAVHEPRAEPIPSPEAENRESVANELQAEPQIVVAPPTEDLKARMFVRIVDDATGFAVARARIERSKDEQPDLESDARGLCSLEFREPEFSIATDREAPLPPSFCRVHAEGFGLAEFRESAGHEREDMALEVRLTKPATLVVSLLGRIDGSAEDYAVRADADAQKLVCNENANGMTFDYTVIHFQANCDAARIARIERLPAKLPLNLTVLLGGVAVRAIPVPVQLEPGEVKHIDIDLGSVCLVRGRVIDQTNAPVEGVEVWIAAKGQYPQPQFAEYDAKGRVALGLTDAAGVFELGSIAPGSYILGLSPTPFPRYRGRSASPFASVNVPVEIADGESVKDVELRVQSGLFISGRVVQPDGSLLDKGSQISAASVSGSGHQQTASARDGLFTIGPLLAGRYRLNAGGAKGFAQSLDVEAEAGASDVVLALRRGSNVLLRVVDTPGGPGVKAELAIAYLDGSKSMTMNGNTPGFFPLSGQDLGLISIVATTPDGRIGVMASLDLQPDVQPREVELLVSIGAKLHVRLSNDAKLGWLQVKQAGVVVPSPRPQNPGAVTVVVPPGELTVRVGLVETPLVGHEQIVTVTAGEEREVVFEP